MIARHVARLLAQVEQALASTLERELIKMAARGISDEEIAGVIAWQAEQWEIERPALVEQIRHMLTREAAWQQATERVH